VTSRILALIPVLLFSAQCASTRVVSQRPTSVLCAAGLPDEVASEGDPGVESPVLLHPVYANFTADAMRAKVHGSVHLRGIVDGSGAVREVCVLRALEPSLDVAAREAFAQWTFRPATRRGKPVAMAVSVQMAFTTR
jgi:TonB family protein